MKTRDALVYAEGRALGEEWAQLDARDHIASAHEIALLEEESRSDQRWARAFYLGALRGYRSVARTFKYGRWGL